jgi:Tol biopolymer transport system component/predicted Ser/Thr protein kinase
MADFKVPISVDGVYQDRSRLLDGWLLSPAITSPRNRFRIDRAVQNFRTPVVRKRGWAMVGRTISHYQILEKLGEGGMGVVYKARDTHLDRFVAIKVLPPEKVTDPERRQRFTQEAKAASALNHPNIITVHDIDEADGVSFISMEFVAGKTLDSLIPRHGLRLSEVLKYAIQIADALARAHAAGIIHRDLKPGNIMVTEQGLVKVLDFGLAKLTEAAPAGDDEVTRTMKRATEEGTIVGTVAYMSPEQAEGKKVDARSDVFSFGAVLYEMVTGQKAFQGDSKMSTLAAIMNKDPKPAGAISTSLPRDLEKIITRCLRKDREQRLQYMADIKVTLQELKEESDSGTQAGAQTAMRPTRRPWLWAAAALVVLAIAFATWLFRGTARKPVAAPEVVPLTSYAGFENSPSFSPDGNQVAFSWNGEKQDNFDIYVKLIGSPTPLRLTTDAAEDRSPAFSPDGRSIGFVRVSREHRAFIIIPSIGGPEHIVADNLLNYSTWSTIVGHWTWSTIVGHWFAWFPNGKWVVTDGLAMISIESGETHSLTSPPMKSLLDFSPAVSPDGHTIAFSRLTSALASDIYLLDLDEDLKPKGEPRRLTFLKRNSYDSAWTPNGQEIIFGSRIFSSPSLFRVSTSGSGQPEQLPFTGENAFSPAISRSGNRLAYQRDLSDGNIWRLSLSVSGTAAEPPTRFIASTRDEYNPQYSPDGKWIAFSSDRSGVQSIWVSDAEGSNAVELFSRASAVCGTPRWSPDGQRIAFDSDAEGNFDIYIIRSGGGKAVRLTTDSTDDLIPSWSRDGNWVYFGSERSGRSEVWKAPAGGGEAIQVTRNGGYVAFESPDGKFVYYTKDEDSSALWKMPLTGGEESQVLPSVDWRNFSLINEGIYFIPGPGADGKYSIQFLSFATGKVKTVAPIPGQLTIGLSVSPDGRSLLFSEDDEAGSDLKLVENFR